MATTIDSTALFFGAPASLAVGGVEVGATTTPPKATIEATQYAPEFQGAGGPVSGAVFNTKIKAVIEFDVNEITGAKLAWNMPGSTSVVGSAAVTAGGLSTTVDVDTAAGATVIPITSTTALAAGHWLKIGDPGNTEVRQVLSVAAAVSATLTQAMSRAHHATEPAVQVDDAGTTVTTWRTGRVASDEFQSVVLDGTGVDGRHLKITVTNALSDGKLNIEMSDSAVAGSHVVMTGYYDGSDPTLAPVSIEVG
jgi:hypothetical protein